MAPRTDFEVGEERLVGGRGVVYQLGDGLSMFYGVGTLYK